MSVKMADMTYGRNVDGRKKLVSDLSNDIDKAAKKMTGESLKNVKDVVKKYWSGADANKFISELESKAKNAANKCKKYKEIVESNLTTDAKSFTSFQDKNANDIAGIK